MNPLKLGKLDNHDQGPWKMPLRQCIEHFCSERFGGPLPGAFMSVDGQLPLERREREARRGAEQPDTEETP